MHIASANYANPTVLQPRRSVRHATAQGSVQGLVQYFSTASKLHVGLCSTSSIDPRSLCCSAFENYDRACTFLQQATKPDFAEPASLVRLSGKLSMALNATDRQGPWQSQSSKGSGGPKTCSTQVNGTIHSKTYNPCGEQPATEQKDSTIEFSTECICSVLIKFFTLNVEQGFLSPIECNTGSWHLQRATQQGWVVLLGGHAWLRKSTVHGRLEQRRGSFLRH